MRLGLAITCGWFAFFALGVRAETPTTDSLALRKEWTLAFVKKNDIWRANGDGTDQKRLIRNASSPCWSPDKKQIAFARNGNIWTAKADGTAQRQLTFRWEKTEEPGSLFAHAWGGESEFIDMSWNRATGVITFSHWDKFRVTRLGSKDRKDIWACSIFDVPSTSTRDEDLRVRFDLRDNVRFYRMSNYNHPAWSPDGKHLAFVCDLDIWMTSRAPEQVAKEQRDPRWDWLDFWHMVVQVTDGGQIDWPIGHGSNWTSGVNHIAWSPDGARLVYDERRFHGTGIANVYVLNVEKFVQAIEDEPPRYDSKGATMGAREQIKPVKFEESTLIYDNGGTPCFSPDGNLIAHEAPTGIWVSTLDGKLKRILIESEDARQPAWW